MSSGTRLSFIIVACLLSILNAVALVINLSPTAAAAVGDMNYQQLLRDPDFTRAVKTIAEHCKVNVDLARLECRAG